MRIAVLGARGFLGQRLLHSLSRAGHEVIAVSRGPEPADLPAGTRYVQATIDDSAALEPVLAISDYAIDLAWDTTPGTSQRQPVLEVSANVLPHARLIEMLQRCERCRFVFISTGGALYAGSDTLLDESSPLAPRSYYGAAKCAVEQMLHAYQAQTGHTALVVRPPNVYGPGQIPKRQFGIVPTLMRCAITGSEFEIWGDGEAIRDYLFIEDFERFIDSLVTRNSAETGFECFNAGGGAPLSINELCNAVERVAERRVRRRFHPPRRVDSRAVMLNAARARKLLDWEASTSIDEGLRKTWSWLNNIQ